MCASAQGESYQACPLGPRRREAQPQPQLTHELNPYEADCVSEEAGAISTLGAREMGQDRPINVQNVLLWPSHPPRPRKLAPWAATSWRTVRKAPGRLGGGWCFVDVEVLAVRVSGRMAVESERGQCRLAWARREKCQKSRSDPKHAVGRNPAPRNDADGRMDRPRVARRRAANAGEGPDQAEEKWR